MGVFGFIGDGAKWVGKKVFGDGEDPGALGTGQYDVDENAAKIGGAEQMRQTYQEGAQQAATRTGATVDTAPQGEFRQGQSALAQALQAQAAGQGPSLAQAQLGQATDRNLRQGLAMANSTRGMGGAGAARAVAAQRGDIGQQAAADAAQLRSVEQMQAQSALGQVLAGARGQDLALATANQDAEMQQRQLNDQMVQEYLQKGLTLAQAEQQAALEIERLKLQSYQGTAKNRADFSGKVAGAVGQAAGAGAGAGGAGAAAAP